MLLLELNVREKCGQILALEWALKKFTRALNVLESSGYYGTPCSAWFIFSLRYRFMRFANDKLFYCLQEPTKLR